MKFTIVATVLALALAMDVAQGSIIPLGVRELAGNGLSYTAVSGPLPILAPAPAAVAVHVSSPWANVPSPVVLSAPVPQVVLSPAIEGTYVAKTRGAIHTAPLSGHAISAAAINVAPAPGTV